MNADGAQRSGDPSVAALPLLCIASPAASHPAEPAVVKPRPSPARQG